MIVFSKRMTNQYGRERRNMAAPLPNPVFVFVTVRAGDQDGDDGGDERDDEREGHC